MSYEPTAWKKGDKVTSTKLNKIEQGIQGNDNEISELKEGLNAIQTATASDVGKALKAKTVTDGKVTEWEFGGTVELDATLTDPIKAAQAKAVGDAINSFYKTKDIPWVRGVHGATGSVDGKNGVTSGIITNIHSLTLTSGCRAVILLYSDGVYLGKCNADNTISKTSGNWKYFTGSIDFGTLFTTFNANGLSISVMPTDGTTITADSAKGYGDTHCIVKATSEEQERQIATLTSSVFVPYKMSDVFERRLPDDYSYTGENKNRSRVKIGFLQRVPTGATKCTVNISSASLDNGNYRAGFCFYDENYQQINGTAKGWFSTSASVTFDSIGANYKYFALYYATNNATEIILDDIKHTLNSVVFDTSDTNYCEELLKTPASDFDANMQKKGYSEYPSGYYSVNHRGYNIDAPENTLPAFIMSKYKGFSYVETDLEFTSDDVCVLLHDDTINRTGRNADGSEISSTIAIKDITYEQALTYDFGIWKGSKWTGLKIPTFEEFITLCKKLSLHPFIELKDNWNGNVFTEARVATVANTIKKVGMEKHVTFISFNPSALSRMHNLLPNADYGYGKDVSASATYTDAHIQDMISTLTPLKNEFNTVFATLRYTATITEAQYQMFDAEGICQLMWTANDPALANRQWRYSVIGFLSDWLNIGSMITERLYDSLPT